MVKTMLVTGAGSGIGAAVADLAQREGWDVVATDLRSPEVVEVPGAGSSGTGHRVTLAADTTDPEQLQQAVELAVAEFGGLSCLVANAGIGFPESFEQVSRASWTRVMDTNAYGSLLSAQTALPALTASGSGSIVFVASIAARQASVSNGAQYTASKYAIVGLTRHLARELGDTGVRINCVCPGPTVTPLLTSQVSDDAVDAIRERTPLGRLGQPEDVAEVIEFLAGPRARHMHGAIVDVNGGMY